MAKHPSSFVPEGYVQRENGVWYDPNWKPGPPEEAAAWKAHGKAWLSWIINNFEGPEPLSPKEAKTLMEVK